MGSPLSVAGFQVTWAFPVYSVELETAGLVGYLLEKAYGDVGKYQHEVEAVLGSEAHVGVPHPQGQGLCLVYVEQPVKKQQLLLNATLYQMSLHYKLFLNSEVILHPA